MARYHITDRGEAGLCAATQGRCPYGGDDDHYPSAFVARAAFEVAMGDYGMPAHSKTSSFTSVAQFLEEAAVQDPEPYEPLNEWALPRSMGVSPARFGLQPMPADAPVVPHQAEAFWDSYPEELVSLEARAVHTGQEVIRYGGVRHYVQQPTEPLDEFTELEGIAVKAVLTKDGAIVIQEGNHRTAAALLARRPLLMVLAPEADVRDYWDRMSAEDSP